MVDHEDSEFDAILAARDVHVVFQPIIALESSEIVGVEALARGPVGSQLESPGALFAAARRRDRVAELDWVCRAAAFDAFTRGHLPPAMSLFVNVEPESLGAQCPSDLLDAVSRAESLLRVFVEVNDRALATDPAGLVVAVERARASGWGVALDGVGASRASLAALPVVGADLVKVNLRLLHGHDQAEESAITLSVLRSLEVGAAALLVQGIESAQDAAWARALGATYGQGYHLGEPGPLATSYPFPRMAIPLLRMAETTGPPGSAFEVVSDLGVTTMTREQLDQVAQVAYRAALTPGASPVVLASGGATDPARTEAPAGYPTPPTPPLLFVLFGVDVGPAPYPGVRGVQVEPNDPIAHETFLVILGERDVVGVLAVASGDDAQLVDVVVTQDPVRVHHLARALMGRVPGKAHPTPAPTGPVDAEPDDPEPAPVGDSPTTHRWAKRPWR